MEIRTASTKDLDALAQVEALCFPPSEAAEVLRNIPPDAARRQCHPSGIGIPLAQFRRRRTRNVHVDAADHVNRCTDGEFRPKSRRRIHLHGRHHNMVKTHVRLLSCGFCCISSSINNNITFTLRHQVLFRDNLFFIRPKSGFCDIPADSFLRCLKDSLDAFPKT